jgi:hypothetical protein
MNHHDETPSDRLLDRFAAARADAFILAFEAWAGARGVGGRRRGR